MNGWMKVMSSKSGVIKWISLKRGKLQSHICWISHLVWWNLKQGGGAHCTFSERNKCSNKAQKQGYVRSSFIFIVILIHLPPSVPPPRPPAPPGASPRWRDLLLLRGVVSPPSSSVHHTVLDKQTNVQSSPVLPFKSQQKEKQVKSSKKKIDLLTLIANLSYCST